MQGNESNGRIPPCLQTLRDLSGSQSPSQLQARFQDLLSSCSPNSAGLFPLGAFPVGDINPGRWVAGEQSRPGWLFSPGAAIAPSFLGRACREKPRIFQPGFPHHGKTHKPCLTKSRWFFPQATGDGQWPFRGKQQDWDVLSHPKPSQKIPKHPREKWLQPPAFYISNNSFQSQGVVKDSEPGNHPSQKIPWINWSFGCLCTGKSGQNSGKTPEKESKPSSSRFCEWSCGSELYRVFKEK